MREIKFRAWNGYDFAYMSMDKEPGIYRCGSHKVLEQFTGLQDKSGVDIYEGDIIHLFDDYEFDEHDVKGSIVFSNGVFMIDGYRVWKDGVHDWHSLENIDFDCVKIIGNIHENEGLLT